VLHRLIACKPCVFERWHLPVIYQDADAGGKILHEPAKPASFSTRKLAFSDRLISRIRALAGHTSLTLPLSLRMAFLIVRV
jgi:hypothetical protein